MTLFIGIPKDNTNADIGIWMQNRAPFYMSGYRLAAEKLSDGFGNLPTNEKDSLIFPIVYLYRHHIELATKEIIKDIRKLLGDANTKDLVDHKILELWDKLSHLYLVLEKQLSPNYSFTNSFELKKARVVINELSNIDKLSFSFRYSTEKQGEKVLSGIDYISLDNFTSEIKIVLNVIDNIFESISHEAELRTYAME